MSDFTEGFRSAVMAAFVRHGDAYSDEKSWGDTRGEWDYAALRHFSEKCKPVKMNNMKEAYTWQEWDTMSAEDKVGMAAELSCECGKYTDVRFVLPEANIGTVLRWLLEDA